MMNDRLKMIGLSLLAALFIMACGLISGLTEPTPTPLPTLAPTATPEPAEPTPTPDPEPEPQATNDPAGGTTSNQIEIVQVAYFLDDFDTYNVVGLVTNFTDRMIDDVEIEIELFDAAGNSLYVETTFAELFYLAPGESSPFILPLFEELPAPVDRVEAVIVGNSVAEITRAVPDIENVLRTVDDDGDVHITGEIFNNTDRPLEVNNLAAAVFDSQGQILTADSYSVAVRYLDPGDSGPFRISLNTPPGSAPAIASHLIYLDAEVAEPLAGIQVTISEALDYQDTFGNLHLVGELTNEGESALNIRILAGIYDALGNVLDAAYYDIPISTLDSGESIPYDFDFWGPVNYTSDLLALADSYTIQVDGYWTWESDAEIIRLDSTGSDIQFGEFSTEATGTVVNNSGGPVDSVVIVVSLRDRTSGRVVAFGTDFHFEEIASGGTAEYEVFLDVPADLDPGSVEAVVDITAESP